MARIRAVLRRRAPEEINERVEIGGLVLDAATYRVTFRCQPLKAGPTESLLLHFLMKHPERVHSRSQLLDRVWGDHVFIEERNPSMYTSSAFGKPWVLREAIETVRGAGYRFTAQPESLKQAAL